MSCKELQEMKGEQMKQTEIVGVEDTLIPDDWEVAN